MEVVTTEGGIKKALDGAKKPLKIFLILRIYIPATAIYNI